MDPIPSREWGERAHAYRGQAPSGNEASLQTCSGRFSWRLFIVGTTHKGVGRMRGKMRGLKQPETSIT